MQKKTTVTATTPPTQNSNHLNVLMLVVCCNRGDDSSKINAEMMAATAVLVFVMENFMLRTHICLHISLMHIMIISFHGSEV